LTRTADKSPKGCDLIAALAALLALLEAGGKSAQTEAINANLQASDLWAFFQAKPARMTTIQTAARECRT
jgi:hypothetical protein